MKTNTTILWPPLAPLRTPGRVQAFQLPGLCLVLLLLLSLGTVQKTEAAYVGPKVYSTNQTYSKFTIHTNTFTVPSGTHTLEMDRKVGSSNTTQYKREFYLTPSNNNPYYSDANGDFYQLYIHDTHKPDEWKVTIYVSPGETRNIKLDIYAYGDGRDTHDIAQFYLDYNAWAGDDISLAYYYYYDGCANYQDKNFDGNYYHALYYYYIGSAYCCYYYYLQSYPYAANYYFLYQTAYAYYYYSYDRYGADTANYWYSLYMYYANQYLR